MNKYIDAERLKKIVEQARQLALEGVVVLGDYYYDGRADAFGEVLLEIKSLQELPSSQSHWKPGKDEITAIEVALKFLLAHTSDEQLCKNVISVLEHLKQL